MVHMWSREGAMDVNIELVDYYQPLLPGKSIRSQWSCASVTSPGSGTAAPPMAVAWR